MPDWFLHHIPELAIGAALAWGAGLRLYLVLLVVGLLGRYGYLPLPEALQILTNPMVVAAAAFMAFVEFFADKIPYVDSLWDAVHTVLRIPAGAALAAGMMGDSGQGAALAAAIIGGTIAAGTHFGKAGARAAINTSPEPVSNVAASLAEDGLVAGGLALALTHPLVFLALLLAFLIGVAAMLRFLMRALRRLIASRRGRAVPSQ